MMIEEEGKEIAKPILNTINEKIRHHTDNINEDITKLIQRIEQLEHEQKILNTYNTALEKEINYIKDDYRRLNNDSNSNYEVLVELNRRVDTITGDIPTQLQLNDDDTECHITKDDRVHYITNTLQELIQEVKELNNDGK